MWNFLHCHPVMCLECKVHTKFSVYWKVAARLRQNTVNLLHLKYLLQLRTRVQWSNPPLQIGVIVPVGRFGLLLQSIWCPRCAGIYSYIHPACSSRCNRHFCQENYRFSDGKNRNSQSFGCDSARMCWEWSTPCRVSLQLLLELLLLTGCLLCEQENVAMEFMEVFVVVSMATGLSKELNGREASVNGNHWRPLYLSVKFLEIDMCLHM